MQIWLNFFQKNSHSLPLLRLCCLRYPCATFAQDDERPTLPVGHPILSTCHLFFKTHTGAGVNF